MDHRINNRAQNYKSCNRNIQKYREERSLMLRKEKIFDNIMNKRMTSLEGKFKESEIEFEGQSDVSIPSNEIKNVMNPCMLSIQSNTIQIPEEELKHFDEITDKIKKVEMLKHYLSKNETNGYNYKNFAIYHLKSSFLKTFQSISIRMSLLDEDLCLRILNEYLVSRNIAALCDLGFILTQMTFYSDKACDMLLDENILKELIHKISMNNLKIQEDILVIIGNLIIQHKEFVLNNTDYILVLKQILINQQNLVESWNNSDLRKIVLWNISLIINNMANQELSQFECLIPIFKSYLKKENIREMKRLDKNQEEIYQLLTILSDLSNNDLIIESLIINRFFDDLVYLLQYLNIAYCKEMKHDPANLIILTSNNLLLLLKTLNNIFCGTDDLLNHYKVLNSDLIEILENLMMRYRFFQKEDKRIVSEIIWVLSNIMAGPSPNQDIIMGTCIPRNLLRFYANKDPKLLNEVVTFFEQVLIKGSRYAILEILKLNIIQFIIDSIKSHDDQNIIKTCLNCIGYLIKLSHDLYSSIDGKDFNTIFSELMKYSIITRLEQLAIHSNSEISKISQGLLKKLEKMIEEDQIMS